MMNIGNVIKTNSLKFALIIAILCLGTGMAIFVSLALYPSFVIIIIGALFYYLCAISQVTIAVLSIYLFLRRVISIKQCAIVAGISVAALYIGTKIMYFTNDFSEISRVYIVNDSNYDAKAIVIGKFSDKKFELIKRGKSRFTTIPLHRSCEIPISYVLNKRVINDTLCGCHDMTIGENVKYTIKEIPSMHNCHE